MRTLTQEQALLIIAEREAWIALCDDVFLFNDIHEFREWTAQYQNLKGSLLKAEPEHQAQMTWARDVLSNVVIPPAQQSDGDDHGEMVLKTAYDGMVGTALEIKSRLDKADEKLSEARAAIKWLIENDGSWTMDDDIPEDCRSIICEIRDQMYSASAKACES